ncbi:hypothetical protein [Absidia glauca]|uniref:Carbohydrate kinase PfkB domain-containing protein n=1 Tax=Absidia glauca TaxID=4829 RepID=A0A163JXF5_ABSGL|nr:hypothetical protein [Absidia glauca]
MFSFHRRRSLTPSVNLNKSALTSKAKRPHPQTRHSYHTSSTSSPLSTINILLVGQIYEETVLYVDEYPKESNQIHAKKTIQRQGGSICNTAEVLSQFPSLDPCIMSCLGSKSDSSGVVASLEDKGINTKTCTYRQIPIPSTVIIQNSHCGSRTVIASNERIDLTKDEFIGHFSRASVNKTMEAPYSWVHFECRSVYTVLDQIGWLETKAMQEGWRSQLTISLDLDNPTLLDIELLFPKADVVFFSKTFAQSRHFYHPKDFLRSIYPQCKSGWGEGGTTCLLNPDELIHASAIPTHDVVDPAGAKDTFIAGIIFCLCRHLSAMTALKFSCEMANRKVGKMGFDGLAELMWKLWEASLDMAATQKSFNANSLVSGSPLVTAFKAMELGASSGSSSPDASILVE